MVHTALIRIIVLKGHITLKGFMVHIPQNRVFSSIGVYDPGLGFRV